MEERFERYRQAPVAWDPIRGGKRGIVCFKDSLCGMIGEDTEGRFDRISEKMLSGDYYPEDAVQFFGRFRDEDRHMRAGDRVLQRARLLPFLKGIYVWSMVEIYVAEKTGEHCRIGYVTTKKHHGRGIWTATLSRAEDGDLELTVNSTASPNSWMFWLGLPYARFLQLRARRRGIQNMASV